jgi:FkbM family methyltransferase
MFTSRYVYYLSSILTLIFGVQNWPLIMFKLARQTNRPFILNLKIGYRFWVRSLMDIWIIKETCLDRDYERNSTRIKDNWVVIDIGAGLGDFTISAACEHPSNHIYAYEPFPNSFNLLQDNLALNHVANVSAFPYAIGAHSGTIYLDTTTEIAVQHSTAKTVPSSNTKTALQVTSLSLDDIFEEQQLSCCDFLKIDCEGGEYDILFNASEMTLKKTRNICLEYHNGVTHFSHNDLVTYLRQKGFQVKTIPNPVHKNLGFLYANQ